MKLIITTIFFLISLLESLISINNEFFIYSTIFVSLSLMLTILEKYNKCLDKKIHELYNLFDIDILFNYDLFIITDKHYYLNFVQKRKHIRILKKQLIFYKGV